MTNMHDSGKRQSFTTGAVRDTAEGKSRPDLISPFALERLGEWLRLGAQKYSERNWESGIPVSRCIASIWRHLLAYQQGRREEDHLIAIMCNIMFIAHYEHEITAGRLSVELDDMPKYGRREIVLGTHRRNPQTEIPEIYCRAGEAIFVHNVERYRELQLRVESGELLNDSENAELQRLQRRPTFYIAGPMTGYPRLNFDAFDYARDLGKSLGYRCISPADLDREAGTDPDKPETIKPLTQERLDEIIQRDIEAIMALNPANSDGIAVLPGWEKSKGARAEVALAKWRRLRIVSAMNFTLPIKVEY